MTTACGVKDDPIPPSKPIEIDDGNPFKNQRFDDSSVGANTAPTASPSPTAKPQKQKKGKKKWRSRFLSTTAVETTLFL